mmetsp:Transcript_5014/g.13339  ORF Transcript_5014/g.13339 Transcript_5014/m.13339 type:complete len:87 (-) Transcript_5014:928-1188(-)
MKKRSKTAQSSPRRARRATKTTNEQINERTRQDSKIRQDETQANHHCLKGAPKRGGSEYAPYTKPKSYTLYIRVIAFDNSVIHESK